MHVSDICARIVLVTKVNKSHYCKLRKKGNTGLWVVPKPKFQMQTRRQLIPSAGEQAQPVGSGNATQHKDVHRDYNSSVVQSHRRQRESGWGSGRRMGRLRWALSVSEFRSRKGFNRCVAAITQAREAQTHKHPKKSLVRIWESREDKMEHQAPWSWRPGRESTNSSCIIIRVFALSTCTVFSGC